MEVTEVAELTVARATASGRGAVATILVHTELNSGTQTWSSNPFRAVNGQHFLRQPLNRIAFGRWGDDPGEEVVVCRTSERDWEIHCHGGFAATERILADLQSVGASIISWDEKVLNQYGRLQRECEVALSNATTVRTATILLCQEVNWRNWAADFSRLILNAEWLEATESIRQILDWSEYGRHLVEPFHVVLTGKPNVGKSSLINSLVGFQRSIVFDQPGTTRDVVTAETVWDGWPVLLADTAGLRENAIGLEASGILLARQQIARADLVVSVEDASERFETESNPVWKQHPDLRETQIFRVANKIDLILDGRNEQQSADLAVSALTGAGLELMIAELVRRLVPAHPPKNLPIPFSRELVEWLEQLDSLTTSRSETAVIEQHLANLLQRRPA
ncbi:MAG: small GTP-binding protein [Planctomycetaceae bacterium]|nr:small GTP-binding protein [Planctomycetaceae bacterium]